ncbi:MAG: aminotransferase class III-fold pyridoxal phosphate-dependent enzyme [bacterium]
MDINTIKSAITGNPEQSIAGLQSDWWTEVSPEIWPSHGSYLRDISGKEYLDFNGFFASSPVRFDHPDLREKSFLEKISHAAIYRPTLSDFWTKEFAEFIQIFRQLAVPSHMDHFFFIEGGALSVENALKAAFDWKVRLNMQKQIITDDPQEINQPLGTKVIHFENSFHGRSGYTLSITHTCDPRKYKYFPKFDWFTIDPPVLTFDNQGKVNNKPEVENKLEKAVEHLKTILTQHGHDIAAIIIEPIQCEGGDRYLPRELFIQLRQLSEEYDVLLIYDEIQTGFGTTGTMWAHEHFGKKALPDLITFSKKAQTGGVMANHEKISRIKKHVFGNTEESKSRLNSTWGGNIVDMIRCAEYLKIIKKENLLQNTRVMGDYLLTSIQNLCQENSHLLGNPRGKGLLIGFDVIDANHSHKELCHYFKQEYLLCLKCGNHTVRLRPHLDITKDEIDDGLQRMRKALSKLKA